MVLDMAVSDRIHRGHNNDFVAFVAIYCVVILDNRTYLSGGQDLCLVAKIMKTHSVRPTER